MKRLFLLLVAAVTFCGCATVRTDVRNAAAAWPLARGTRWVYDGTRVQTLGQGRVATNSVRLTCEVLESQTQRGHRVAKLRNFPLAISPWEAVASNTVVLIRTPGGAIHALEDSQAQHVLARLADAKDALDNLLDAETQVLAWPLRAGQRWGGDAAALQRLDGWYGWQVESQRAARRYGLAGLLWWRKQAVFEIAYRTCAEHIAMQFVPGVGLLAYEDVHHGTPAEVHLKLVEFHPKK